MSETSTVRRVAGDVVSVSRHACPASATRWLASFAAHVADCRSTRSLVPADRTWTRTGARFRPPGGPVISLPAAYTAGAREMYCRNVYLRTGIRMPRTGWVLDLGANRGLFSVWAALAGAQVVAVEAQRGFAPEIRHLAAHNGVSDRVHVEIALAGGTVTNGASAGVVADDRRWDATSHGAPKRPVPGRADHQVPPGRRARPETAFGHRDRGPARGQPAVHPRPGQGKGAPAGWRQAPDQARQGPGRQGVRFAGQPGVPAPSRDPLHDPGEEGPGRQPEEEGQLRPPARLRRRDLQAATCKPHCCHRRGVSALSSVPSRSVLMLAA
jgi:hypothetical protein